MKVAVIGLGYVGLPLAIRLSLSNFEVTGIDKNAQKINLLKKGKLPFAKNEPGLLKFFQKATTLHNIKFSQSFDDLKDSKVIFICVDTPTRGIKPDNSSLIAATKNIAKILQKGQVIVVESTVAPKTTMTTVAPILEKSPAKLKLNRDFYLATAPERVRPNYIFKQLTTLSRAIGISSPKIQKLLQSIYSKITSGHLDFTDPTTAEVVKTVENAYRDVQIAFANEIALACEQLGVDVWQVRDLVNKSPFRQMHEPGSGVGGHCLPKDPWLLYDSVKPLKPDIIKAARQINDSMPKHIFELITKALAQKGISQKRAQITILGYSYVKNTDDTRNSPSQSLVSILDQNNITYRIHDPQVEKYSKKNPYEIAQNSDCLVLLVDHDDYLKLNLEKLAKITRHQILIDGRNFFRRKTLERLGFLYKGIGNV